MTPYNYIDLVEFDLRIQFKKLPHKYSIEEENAFFARFRDVINLIKPLRHSFIKTSGILQREIYYLHELEEGKKFNELFCYWLTKALKADISYGIAFNCMVELLKANYGISEFEEITDKDLIRVRLFEEQKRNEVEIIAPEEKSLSKLKHRDDDNLKLWILRDTFLEFKEIEVELSERGYIDNSFKWLRHKTELVDFIHVVLYFKFVKPIVDGKKLQAFHVRHFFSKRYGFEKTDLSETWKKHKPKIKNALISFFWIKEPF